MKTPKTSQPCSAHRSIPKTHAALALILIGLSPAIAGGQETNPAGLEAETRANVSSTEAGMHKAELDVIDRQIEIIEQQLAQAPEGPEREAARLRLDALKEQRTELRKAYVASKFDQLKADVRAEYEKVAAWTKNKYQDVKDSLAGPPPDAAAQAATTTNLSANAARAGIALYQMHPSPENKEDVKHALDALEDEIDRLEDHAESMPKGEQREALERRVNALEDRKDALERDFTQARWDALVADLKREWNKLIH